MFNGNDDTYGDLKVWVKVWRRLPFDCFLGNRMVKVLGEFESLLCWQEISSNYTESPQGFYWKSTRFVVSKELLMNEPRQQNRKGNKWTFWTDYGGNSIFLCKPVQDRGAAVKELRKDVRGPRVRLDMGNERPTKPQDSMVFLNQQQLFWEFWADVFLQKKQIYFAIHGSNRRIEIPFSIDKSMGCKHLFVWFFGL